MAFQSKAVIKRIQVDVTLDTNAYASGDAMHTGIIKLANALQYNGSGQIIGICLTDLDKKNTDFGIIFAKSNLPNTTITANAALDIADGDLKDLLGHVKIVAADYQSLSDNSMATKECMIAVDCGEGVRDLYCVLISNDTDTFITAGAFKLSVFVEQD